MRTTATVQAADYLPVAVPITPLTLALSFAVRPSRLRLGLVRLELLLRTVDKPLVRGVLGAVMFGLSAFASARLLFLASNFGWEVTASVATNTAMAALASLLGGAGLLAVACASSRDELDRGELDTGVLLNLSPEGLCATVRGTTVYCDWRLVRAAHSREGIALVLPRGTFHLVPREVLRTVQPRDLRDLLLNAGARPFGGELQPFESTE